jgi:pyruvate, water dikinase
MNIGKEMNSFVKSAIDSMNPDSSQKADNSPGLSHDGDSERYIRWFSESSNKDISIVGGKGASLAEMFNAKFPVPPGFSITTHAFDFFMGHNALNEKISEILESIEREETEDLQNASKEIRALIEAQEIPKELEKEIFEAYHILGAEKIDTRGISQDALNILKNSQEPLFVSVRSSATTEDLATASFAGQQDSFLNIKGNRSLLEHVKKCFSSLYTARAIYYRTKQGFKEGEAKLSIVIQKMVDSEKSGVIFSRDPTNKSDHIIVEAVYGLGEGIVSGKISPDHYLANRDLTIEKIKTSEKKIAIVRNSSGKNETVRLNPERSKSQVLTNGEILEAADFAIKLEEHYGKPQDIEFAIEDKKLYIVQSRPITTLKKIEEEGGEISGNEILSGLGSSPGIGVGVVRIVDSMEDLSKIKKGDVLVTEMTNPDMVVAMEKSVAIVTNEGGMTSHASIVSREIGIPCVVGTGTATETLKDGTKITVDGSNGKVYEGEVAKTTSVEIKPALETKKINLKLIVDLPKFAERSAEAKLDGVGLTRVEGMIASMGKHPLLYEKEGKLEEYTNILKEGLGDILKPFKQIWIRSSDIRTDEYASLKGAPEREINPMLGMHGIRFSLKHPQIFEAELKAVKYLAEKNPEKKVGMMFPQIISIEEVREAKKYFNKFKTENMQFGVMVETPAAVQIIDDICEEGVDFISFGTNDLTQFTLGVDRGEDQVQHLYNELHPALFSQIKKVIESCKEHNVESSICGQAGSNKEMLEFLFKTGIDSVSVNADAAYDSSKLIQELEAHGEKELEAQKMEEEAEAKIIREESRRKDEEAKREREAEDRRREDETIREREEGIRKREEEVRRREEEIKREREAEDRRREEDVKKREEAEEKAKELEDVRVAEEQKEEETQNNFSEKKFEDANSQGQESENGGFRRKKKRRKKKKKKHWDKEGVFNPQKNENFSGGNENKSFGENSIVEPSSQAWTRPENKESVLPSLSQENNELAKLPKRNEGFLDKSKIQFSAEPEEEERITEDLERVEERIEEIQEEVEERKNEELMDDKRLEDSIEVTARPVEEEIDYENKFKEYEEEDFGNKDVEVKDFDEEEVNEDVGVYEPEENKSDEKKYKYDFDDFNDYE